MDSIFLCILAMLQSVSVTIDPNLPSPARYFEPPAHRNFSISPSGRYLASASDIPFDEIDYDAIPFDEEEGRRTRIKLADSGIGDRIKIYDLEQEAFVKNLDFYKQKVYSLHWADDDRLLASISIAYDIKYGRNLTFELPAARTFALTPLTDSEAVLLFANDRIALRQNLNLSNIVDPLPDDKNHVLMSAYRNSDLDLWRVNITTGDADRIATGTPKTFAWITDSAGQAAFRLDQNTNGTVMKVFTTQGGKRWRHIISTRLNANGYGEQFWPIARGDKENEIYVLTSNQEHERSAVSIYDLDTGEISPPLLSDEQFDFGGGLIDPHTGRYVGAWLIDDRYRAVFHDESLQKHIDGVASFFSNDANVVLIAASRNLRKIVFEVSSPTIPGDIYIYDRIEQRITPLFNLRPKITPKYISPVEILNVTARDGLAFTAYLTHPASISRDTPAPLVVLPHGGPAIRDYYQFDPTAQFLASRGYRVLQPNFRGSSGYGASFREAGYQEWGGKMQSDVLDAFYHVRERGLIDEDKSCIMGGSYGGYAALYAAINTPEHFRCAISIAGVTDLRGILKYAKSIDRDTYDFNVQQIGNPTTDKAILDQRSPASRAADVTIPLLLIHGRFDDIVPYDQFLKFTKALDKNDADYEWMVLNDGHSFVSLGSTVQTMRRVENFLWQHLDSKN